MEDKINRYAELAAAQKTAKANLKAIEDEMEPLKAELREAVESTKYKELRSRRGWRLFLKPGRASTDIDIQRLALAVPLQTLLLVVKPLVTECRKYVSKSILDRISTTEPGTPILDVEPCAPTHEPVKAEANKSKTENKRVRHIEV